MSQSPFSPTNPNLQIAWDSSSLGPLKECPRKYQLSIVEGWRPKRMALPLAFGIAIHECHELYYKLQAQGQEPAACLRAAVRHALAFGAEPQPDGSHRPWEPDDPKGNRTRENLVRTIVWYHLRYADDPTRTVTLSDGSAAVELSFRWPIGITAPTGEEYLLCGHLDRLVHFADEIWVEDYKHTVQTITPRYLEQFTPDNQMSNYALAAQMVFGLPVRGVIISAHQVAVTFSEFDRGLAARSQEDLTEWLEDLSYWLRQAETFATAGYWPKNDKSCHHYGGCAFLSICTKSRSVREGFLARDFVKQPWNPLETR